LGTPSFPEASFREPHDFLRELLTSQGIEFDAEFFCPHFAGDGCECRKPRTGLLTEYLARVPIDRERSYVIGDRKTDIQLAVNLGIAGILYSADGRTGDSWPAIADRLTRRSRTARVTRKTRETDIGVSVNLDATSPVTIDTGIGFFDHMLEQIGKHGGFALNLVCAGDGHVDEHHIVEDCALALGEALRRALGDKRGIGRYGSAVDADQPPALSPQPSALTQPSALSPQPSLIDITLPMDETLARAVLDLSGRPYFVFDGTFPRERVGELPTELVPHFFRSLCETLGANLHLAVRGQNAHHMVEGCFKSTARALRQALRREGDALPSTKGVL
ncbi:MAG TPA: HAD-IIIA family hydrolase, partial [Rudaea sp.]|nr:HAD-IIIA family hydrolase [Rudaea sp.]